MISFKEMLGDNDISDVPINIQQNMQESLIKFNQFRTIYGKPVIVTSGFRALQHHMDIYRAKGYKDERVPLKSKHLYGYAIDISDPDGTLYQFIVDNPDIMEQCDLYYELGTNRGSSKWVHLQSVPFGSYREGGPRGFWP